MLKKCIKCGIEKPLDSFYRDRRLSDGRFGRCKVCTKEWVVSTEVKARRVRQCKNSLDKGKESLSDNYVIRQICHHNSLTPDEVRQYPELIKTYRELMITNRTIRDERKNRKHQRPSG